MKSTILFLIDTLQTGGAEKSLLDIASRFKKYTPVFIHLFKGDELKSLFDESKIQVFSLNLPASYQFKDIAKRIIPYIEEIKPVLLHSTLFRSDMVARELKKKTGIPLINSLVNNSYSKQRYSNMSIQGKAKLFAIQQWDAFTAKNVDLFVSNSEAIKRSNALALGIKESDVKIIYRGRNAKAFEEVGTDALENLQQQLNLEGKKIFLNVSRLRGRKGQLDLIRAFKVVQEKNNHIILFIAGEGPFRSVLEQEIRILKLQGHVKLLGNRNDVPALLQLADYFVFPSHYEGLPGALIEAMFAKTPIIASSIPENLECVNAEMALLSKRGEVQDLASKMCKAIEAKDWPEKTALARQYALDNFEINAIAAQYEEVYDELLNGNNRKGAKTED